MSGTFVILGSGGWGTAIAVHLARRPGNSVRLWCPRPTSARDLIETRRNERLLPGIEIPANVTITADPAEAVTGADVWVWAVPTAFVRETATRLGPFVSDVPVVSLTKGIEADTFRRPTEVLADVLGVRRLAVLSGPSHAEEVARGRPTSVVVASDDTALSARVQAEFGTDRFRVYTNGDPTGVELAGALKNVLGLAAGICDGLEFGDNAKAALLTRGIAEMTRFGVAHGADPATFAGLAGVGDLITTCFSRHGRNRRLGERLARGEPLSAVLAGPQVAEGVNTSKSVSARAKQMSLDVPIMAAVHDVLYAGKSPLTAVQELMTRRQRDEDRF